MKGNRTVTGQTIAEKIFSKKAGKPVTPGEIVEVEADLVIFVDLGWHMFRKGWDQLVEPKVKYPDRVAVVFDHKVPADTQVTAELHQKWRAFCEEQGISKLGDIGDQGISHQWVVEKTYAQPGMLVVNQDAHANTTGGIGCFATPTGFDVVMDLILGYNTYRVPETIRVSLTGDFPAGVMARDLMHKVARDIEQDGAIDKVIEFQGPAVQKMAIDTRMTLCNMTRKVEAMAGIVAADLITERYFSDRGIRDIELVSSDDDAQYVRELEYDISNIELSVSPPPNPARSIALTEVEGLRIDQAFVGSCAGGRLEDLEAAANVVAGRKIRSGVRFIVSPATQEIYRAASAKGILDQLVQAGATVVAASCATCFGGLNGVLADGEVCIANSTENHPGRMGSTEADIYLASAAVVAASAVAGEISDPRELLLRP
jgi:3-isopropylmalate/(R)-2-methylmalate dehydratase large subunit